MKNEMTNVKALEYVLTNYTDMPSEVYSKLDNMFASLRKKAATRTETASQKISREVKPLVLEVMSEDCMTATDIVKAVAKLNEEYADLTNQRVTTILRQLKEEGKVENATIKGKSYYRLAG